ncbi:hypothetical protein T06_10603 [Trichinella sp. T6]|nr:hypothetical protein T06_10603 [Trichinella sp. T6]
MSAGLVTKELASMFQEMYIRTYTVKINWICDAENGYALKGSEEPQIGLSSTNIGQLAEPFVNSNRNIFMDSYFTSYSTMQHPFELGLTTIGAVFAHRRDVLACLLKVARRDFYSTLAVYMHNKKVTMISYVPKKQQFSSVGFIPRNVESR